MKFMKLSLAAALAVTLAYAEETSDLGISANVAATNNYVWRGMTQSDDAPAIQGGFDLEYKGLYIGVWGSNVDFGDGKTSMEADLYAGYTNSIGSFGYDIGMIQYMYPNSSDELNFAEAYLGLSYDLEFVEVGTKYYLGVDTNDVNVEGEDWEPTDAWEFTASVPLPAEISLDGTYGRYMGYGNYYSVGASKSFGKFDFTLAYAGIKADAEDSDQNNFVASIGTSF